MCCWKTEWIIFFDFVPVVDLYHSPVLLNASHISMSHHVPCFTDHLFSISNLNDFSQLNMLLNLHLDLKWSKWKKPRVYICLFTLTINMKNKYLNALWWFYCIISIFPVQNKPMFPEHYWKRNQIHKSLRVCCLAGILAVLLWSSSESYLLNTDSADRAQNWRDVIKKQLVSLYPITYSIYLSRDTSATACVWWLGR